MSESNMDVTHSDANKKIVFIMSCLALLTIGFSFSLRTSIAGDLGTLFDAVDSLHSSAMVGAALGVAFLGYAIVRTTRAGLDLALDGMKQFQHLRTMDVCRLDTHVRQNHLPTPFAYPVPTPSYIPYHSIYKALKNIYPGLRGRSES